MKYNNFVQKALEYDCRNQFGKSSDVSNIPKDLREFYTQCNPIDVEVDYDDMPMQFVAKDDLESIQRVYNLPNNAYCFASINGDPVFLMDGKIYCSIADRFRPELIANNFDSFIEAF